MPKVLLEMTVSLEATRPAPTSARENPWGAGERNDVRVSA